MRKREPGLDLLRCLALLGVVVFHSFLYNGYYGEAQTGGWMVLAGSVRWLSVSCIGIFLMLTGYLKSRTTDPGACYRGLLPVLLGYLIAAAVSVPVRHFALGDVQSLSVWLTRLFTFSAVYYGWYVEMYIGLVLLSPFINRLLNTLETTKQLLGLAGVLLVLTALPGASPIQLAPDYWRVCYPLTYYVLGAIVYRLQPKVNRAMCLVGAACIAIALGSATVLSTDGALSTALTWEFADMWIAAMVVLLFLGLYRLRTSNGIQRVLAFAAAGCYGGYLLSHLLDAWCYGLTKSWHDPEDYPKLFLCVTLPIYLLSLLCGCLLQYVTARLPVGRRVVAK